MKKLLVFFSLLTICFLSSCEVPTKSDTVMEEKQEQLMKEANSQVGMPAIKNFQEKKLAKYIFELRDKEDLVCYAYLVNHMSGKLIYIGKCMGYGLPYSVQFTNPEKMEIFYQTPITLPQADPNGLFMPTGLSATWLMMLDKDGNPHPVYVEPEIIVSPFELQGV